MAIGPGIQCRMSRAKALSYYCYCYYLIWLSLSSVCVYVQCMIWNAADGSVVSQISVHHDTIYSISWNHNGSAFATACKDRVIRVIDPRSGTVIAVRINSY